MNIEDRIAIAKQLGLPKPRLNALIISILREHELYAEADALEECTPPIDQGVHAFLSEISPDSNDQLGFLAHLRNAYLTLRAMFAPDAKRGV